MRTRLWLSIVSAIMCSCSQDKDQAPDLHTLDLGVDQIDQEWSVGIDTEVPCQPDCEVRQCGDDGCQEVCGVCDGFGMACHDGTCVFVPQCSQGMCQIPAGDYGRGCNAEVDGACWLDEMPWHTVRLDAYEIDQTEVPVATYQACIKDGDCTVPAVDGDTCNLGKPGTENHPMNCVSWEDAKACCEWAGKRLCTEAEWEQAARGPEGRKFPWGNDAPDCTRAHFHNGDPSGEGCGTGATAEVGSYPDGSSHWGCLDMAGNVWEYVSDWYAEDYYKQFNDDVAVNPTGPATGTERVRRGGDMYCRSFHLRTSFRYDADLFYYRNIDGMGFRCCRTLEQ